MVKQDAERMDRKSKRMQELETVNNNVKLLNEMLQHYSTTTATEADTDIMKVGCRGIEVELFLVHLTHWSWGYSAVILNLQFSTSYKG